MAIAGYSQGGQAAAWVAELQPEYAPELHLQGVTLGGVPTDMNLEMNSLNGSRGAGFALAALTGLDFAYPELHLDTHLTPTGRQVIREVREEDCYSTWYYQRKHDGTSVAELTQPDVLTLPEWRHRLAESTVGTKPLTVPAFLYQGTLDELVPFRQYDLLRDAWCHQSQPLAVQVFTGMDHIQALQAGTIPAVQWLADRFAGRPALRTC